MASEKIPYKYKDSSGVSHEVTLDKDLFAFNQADKKIHDVSFKSKPATFLKDAWIRFRKNKSSIAATIILGLIVLLALLLPVTISYDTTTVHASETLLAPKLFAAGTGFWDGTKFYDDVPYDTSTETPATTLNTNAILTDTIKVYEDTTSTASSYASGGYIRVGNQSTESTASVYSPSFEADLKNAATFALTMSVSTNLEELYVNSSYTVSLVYTVDSTLTTLDLVTDSLEYGNAVEFDFVALGVDLSSLPDETTSYQLAITVPAVDDTNHAIYLSNVELTAEGESLVSMSDANAAILARTFTSSGTYVGLYGATITYCSFYYDTYEAAYGETTMTIGSTVLSTYIDSGWMNYDFDVGVSSFERLSDQCPIMEITAQVNRTGLGVTTREVTATVSMYRYYGYTSMPLHIFGTDSSGRDLLKYVAEGTRNSLGMAVIIAAITFIFGLIWGSIEGYFGGTIDLVMERIVDILAYIPSIILITLCVLNFGQTFGVFILSMCITGWIGTSSLTRTQFYRFKKREYVLASRSLGASDTRLIFKHILPNSLGTIITSAVLMIPSAIFAEASVSYLGIGLSGVASLGVILNNNQVYISSDSYLLIFPSVVLALMMISFNLFGNGLRDAFNPSLKGAD